jgi:hypothetical protein
MPQNNRGRLPKKSPERSQAPLYVAIVGLAGSIYSFTLAENIRSVVFFGGGVVAVVGIAYWILNPKHGLD